MCSAKKGGISSTQLDRGARSHPSTQSLSSKATGSQQDCPSLHVTVQLIHGNQGEIEFKISTQQLKPGATVLQLGTTSSQTGSFAFSDSFKSSSN